MGLSKTVKFVLCACLCSLLLSGCGFALRGSAAIPMQLQPIYVSSAVESQEFAQSIRRQLEINNIAVSSHASEARLRVEIELMKPQRRSTALDFEARDAEYELFERCELILSDGSGKMLRGPRVLEQRRLIVNDTDNPVGEQTESSIVRAEMLEQLSIQAVKQVEYWVARLNESQP
ncbi:hypothetical protein IB286_06855 [Spongiibacter sp. KMU-158]|uniref:LPS-assembly lipoprotein LptE n=1 Tax=Spongiibacter pelagi TaxID=2760804 RepID=A0A927C221_9GAMM|nr:hypothetical protein [Spongiibacter pelagi]MBD2858728.1 hypothetical protein [Spongiibacter pelagi]